jgi:capsular exopolysaccharide synthesis family protein
MNPLTRAVQLAKQEQLQKGGVARRNALVPGKIIYSQTRTETLYPGWLKQNRILTGEASDEAARAYKVLRTQVSQRMRQQGWKTLGITSPGHGEGTTLTAINLSISLALEPQHTVLLVDADLRHPSVHTYLGIDVEYGLQEYLQDGMAIEQMLVHPQQNQRLVILPGSKPASNSSEMLSSLDMLELVQQLKKRYPSRLVIFDLPPVLSSDDVLAFAPYLDAMLLVVEEGKTQREQLARAAELLQATNQNLIGTVLNKSAEQNSMHGSY